MTEGAASNGPFCLLVDEMEDPAAKSGEFLKEIAAAQRLHHWTDQPRIAGALAHLGRLDEARSAVKAGLALNPAFSMSRARANWTAISDDPRYLAQNERFYEGMRMAGVPEQ